MRARASRTIRFRLALAIGALIATLAALLLGGVYWWTVSALEQAVDSDLESELGDLADKHRQSGLEHLTREVDRRSEQHVPSSDIYVLAESHFEKITGNLPAWPDEFETGSKGHTVSFERYTSGVRILRHVRMGSRTLPDGRRLLVGRDVTEAVPASSLAAARR